MITLSDKTAQVLFDYARKQWYSDECTAAIDSAMRELDDQLTNRGL